MKFKDYYEVLGIKRSASEDEIKVAYRKLARKFHPDVSKETDAEGRFKEIGEAYAVLKDPEKRAAYDQVSTQNQHGQEFKPPPNWDTGFEFSGSGFNAEDAAQSDFFEAIFGRKNNTNNNFSAKGQDHHAKIMIDLGDAYHGAKRNITLQMPSTDAQGHVRIQERNLEVSIPKGIYAGQHLRLQGQGAPGFGNAGAGDLYLEISFKPHKLFRIDQRDVYLDLPVSPWEAALGATIQVPTPSGSVQLKVPSNTAAGKKLRLKERGIPGKTPGDFYVVITIAVPPAENEKAKEAYLAMAKAFDFNPRAELETSS